MTSFISHNEIYRHLRSPSQVQPQKTLFTNYRFPADDAFNFYRRSNNQVLAHKKNKSTIDKAHTNYITRLKEALHSYNKIKSPLSHSVCHTRALPKLTIKNTALLNVLYSKGTLIKGRALIKSNNDSTILSNVDTLTAKRIDSINYHRNLTKLSNFDYSANKSQEESLTIPSDLNFYSPSQIDSFILQGKLHRLLPVDPKSKKVIIRSKASISFIKRKIRPKEQGWKVMNETVGFSNNILAIQ